LLATRKLLGVVALILLITGVSLPRQTLDIVFVSGLGCCLLAHLANSVYLMRRRANHPEARTRVLLVGTEAEASRVVAAISSNPKVGYAVVGFHSLVTRSEVKRARDIINDYRRELDK
jgi:FlaA1/EpsC-like NDP-sugar epimerase